MGAPGSTTEHPDSLKPCTENESPRCFVVGAGAHGRVVVAIWQRAEPKGTFFFLDDNLALWGTRITGIPVEASVQAFRQFASGTDAIIVAMGDNHTRTSVSEQLSDVAHFANVVDPTAVVMPTVSLGHGILIGPQAIVHAGARIGDHAIINSGAIVEHDCVVEEGATVSSGVRMAGRVEIGSHAFISVGATLVGRIRIGAGAIVGAGAVVVRDVPAGSVAYGVPARVVRRVGCEDWRRLL